MLDLIILIRHQWPIDSFDFWGFSSLNPPQFPVGEENGIGREPQPTEKLQLHSDKSIETGFIIPEQISSAASLPWGKLWWHPMNHEWWLNTARWFYSWLGFCETRMRVRARVCKCLRVCARVCKGVRVWNGVRGSVCTLACNFGGVGRCKWERKEGSIIKDFRSCCSIQQIVLVKLLTIRRRIKELSQSG